VSVDKFEGVARVLVQEADAYVLGGYDQAGDEPESDEFRRGVAYGMRLAAGVIRTVTGTFDDR